MSRHTSIGTAMVPLLLLITQAPAFAQKPAPPAKSAKAAKPADSRCGGRSPVGLLGISGLVCSNCVFSFPGEGKPSLFSTEPRISRIASGSPAASALKVGDTLIGIDNHLITTTAGGQRLANLKPGETVTVDVRRNGERVKHRFARLPAVCPTDARVLGSRATPGSYMTGNNTAARNLAANPGQTPPARATLSRLFTPSLMPRGSFGFGISCNQCEPHRSPDGRTSIHFRDPPEIYSVEPNGQAYRLGIRRGDVITRIDGVSITSPEGGRRFASIEAGQTVTFTLRRGSSTLTRELEAEPRRFTEVQAKANAVAQADQSEASLREMREMVEAMRAQLAQGSEQIEQVKLRQGRELQELTERLLRQRSEQAARIDSVYAELARAQRSMAQAFSGVRSASSGQSSSAAPAPATPTARNTMRYAARLGDTDVEVRGPTGMVVVSENEDEIVITILDSTIRLKKVVRR